MCALVPELSCTNVDLSVAFYRDVLGFRILYQRPETRFAMMERAGAKIMLDEIRATRTWLAGPLELPYGRGINIEIDTPNVEELYASVQASGANIFLPIEEKWYRADDVDIGVKQFIVLDPDGYMLRFSERMETRPSTLMA